MSKKIIMELLDLTEADFEPQDRVGDLEARQGEYEEETDNALFDLDTAQNDYAAETDAALFDLVDYIATLESRIEELEGING